MKVEGYVDFTIEEVKQILADYVRSQGYEPTEVWFPQTLREDSNVNVGIEVPKNGDK